MTSMRTYLSTVATAIVLGTLYVSPVLATGPTLSGAAVINFTYHPQAMPPYWSFDVVPDGFTNTMSLTIPPVIDLSIRPSVIGPGNAQLERPSKLDPAGARHERLHCQPNR